MTDAGLEVVEFRIIPLSSFASQTREAFSFPGRSVAVARAETLKNPSESEIDTNALDRSWGQCVLPSGLCAGAHQ